jgi:hypothetical protein
MLTHAQIIIRTPDGNGFFLAFIAPIGFWESTFLAL